MKTFSRSLVIAILALASSGVEQLFAQSIDVTGTWVATGVPYAPWTVQLKQDGAMLTGTMRQNGGLPGPVDIYEGSIDGSSISFKANSPDNARAITFTGTIDGDRIILNRSTRLITQASMGGTGLFGTNAAPQFTITRELPSDHWVVTEGVAYPPWTINLRIVEGAVTGTVSQAAADEASGFTTTLTGPFPIYDGTADGNTTDFKTVDFKTKTPDGGRIIAFHGIRDGDQIAFTRSVEVVRGDPGRDGILGASGATKFTATLNTGPLPVEASVVPPAARGPRETINIKGVEIDITSIQARANLNDIVNGIRRQIDIVDAAVTDPDQKAFLMSVPMIFAASPGPADNASYSGTTKTVTLLSLSYSPEKPVILHELMHAYHDQKLPNGLANAEIRALYEQARGSGKFPAGSYMLTNPIEYFGMMASVYLHGSAARDPFTREAIKEKQPEFYQWMVKEFGPR